MVRLRLLADRRGVAPLVVVAVLVLVPAVAVGTPIAYDAALGNVTTPRDGILWRVERLGETLRLMLALSPRDKALAHLSLADERIAELQACAEDAGCASACCAEYAKCVDACLSLAERHNMTDVQAMVANATAHHREVLESVLARVPEEARPWVQHAMDVSVRGHEEACRAVERASGMTYEEYMRTHMPRGW